MSKEHDHAEKTQLILDGAIELMATARAKAIETLSADLNASAKELIALTRFSADDALEATSARVRLDGLKVHIKIAAISIDRTEVSGSLTFEPLKLSRPTDV